MTRRPLSTRVSKEADERTAALYERQAERSQAIAYRHARIAIEAAARGDDRRWRFEIAQGRLAWTAVHLDRARAEAIRRREIDPPE